MEFKSERERYENGMLGREIPRHLARFILSLLEKVDDAITWEEEDD